MATITGAAGGGNWSVGATWVGGVAPTAADDVLLTATSGAITIDGTSGSPNLCRSLNCTGYVGTLTQGAAATLNIGDGSGGSLTLVSGMTYVPNATAVINFVSTTTGNTITTAGKAMSVLNFTGVGGGWTVQDNMTGNATGATINLTGGSLDLNSKTFTSFALLVSGTNTRSLTMGTSTFTLRDTSTMFDATTTTNLTFSAASSTIQKTAASANNPQFIGGGLTFGTVTFNMPSNGGSITISGANTFANLSAIGNGGTQFEALVLSANQTVTGALSLTGNTNLKYLNVVGSPHGTARTITANGTITVSNVNFRDIVGAGSASWNQSGATSFGDLGRNSGITFTTPITIYYFSNTGSPTSSGKWFSATNGGGSATRPPLPQDTLRFDANSFSLAAQTFSMGNSQFVPKMDWTGVTNNPTISINPGTSTFYMRDLTLVAGMTVTGSATNSFYFVGDSGASTVTVTMAGQTMVSAAHVLTSGTVNFADAFTCSATITSNFSLGTVNFQNNLTYSSTGLVNNSNCVTTITGTLTMGSTSATSLQQSGSSGSLTFGGTVSLSGGISLSNGTLNLNGASVTSTVFAASNTATLNMSSSTHTLNGTGTVWSIVAGNTINAGTSTLVVSDTSATSKVFTGAGKTYNSITFSGDNITFTGSNTFTGVFQLNNAGLTNGLKVASGTTQTLTNSSTMPFSSNGSAGNLAIMTSTAGSAYTFTAPNYANPISEDYLSLKDSTVTQTNRWYAGTHSTNVSGNTNWIFAAPPPSCDSWIPYLPDFARAPRPIVRTGLSVYPYNAATKEVVYPDKWTPRYPDFILPKKRDFYDGQFSFPWGLSYAPPPTLDMWIGEYPDFARARKPIVRQGLFVYPQGIVTREVVFIDKWAPSYPDFARKAKPLVGEGWIAYPWTFPNVVLMDKWNPSYPDFARKFKPLVPTGIFTSQVGVVEAQIAFPDRWQPHFPDYIWKAARLQPGLQLITKPTFIESYQIIYFSTDDLFNFFAT